MEQAKTIWQITDGKRGHENQCSGLIKELHSLRPLKTHTVDISSHRASWWSALRRHFPYAQQLPKPDLIIGAGSQTHSTLLAAGRATGAPTVVVMAPPRGLAGLFSLCIIPEHDNRNGPNIVTTKGAMNLIHPSQNKEATNGLILVGGPSQHHDWSEEKLLEQIQVILAAEHETEWTLTTSRRTPASTTQTLLTDSRKNLTVVPVEATSSNWLPEHLALASKVWVTEDSVSMVYEALSSGAKVGLLSVPRKTNQSRIIRGLDALVEAKFVYPYDATQPKLNFYPKPPTLNEAERIAKIVDQQFLAS